MKKLGTNLIGVGILLACVLVTNLRANPLPSCGDEWCHYTTPNTLYVDYNIKDNFPPEQEEQDWMNTNCPNWPDLSEPLFRVLPYLNMHMMFENDVNKVWQKGHPEEKRIGFTFPVKKQWEEYYQGKQKEQYGKNIPYCLTKEAQNRLQEEKQATAKYLYDAQNSPIVRDRLALIAKLEEANAKTAQELELETYIIPTPGIDKTITDSWWEETHPNGQVLDKQAIKKRYEDFFTNYGKSENFLIKRLWHEIYSNEPEPSLDEMKKQIEERKRQLISKLTKREREMAKELEQLGYVRLEEDEDFDLEKINELTRLGYTFEEQDAEKLMKISNRAILTGLIALGIVAMAAIVLLRRKKNLPK